MYLVCKIREELEATKLNPICLFGEFFLDEIENIMYVKELVLGPQSNEIKP